MGKYVLIEISNEAAADVNANQTKPPVSCITSCFSPKLHFFFPWNWCFKGIKSVILQRHTSFVSSSVLAFRELSKHQLRGTFLGQVSQIQRKYITETQINENKQMHGLGFVVSDLVWYFAHLYIVMNIKSVVLLTLHYICRNPAQ